MSSWESTFRTAENIIRRATRPLLQRALDDEDASGKSGWDRANSDRAKREKKNRSPLPRLKPPIDDWSADECVSVLLNDFDIFQPYMKDMQESWRDYKKPPFARRGWLNDLVLLRNKHAH